MKIVLASKSPRRIDIFNRLGMTFTTAAAEIDENKTLLYKKSPVPCINFLRAAQAVQNTAYEKFRKVCPSFPQHIIYSFDTVLYFKGEIIGKPNNRKNAEKILMSLSGKTHKVMTGCVKGITTETGKEKILKKKIYTTNVTFKKLSKQMINIYLKNGEYTDAAGAYKIQDAGIRLIKRIRGCYHNVVGLPLEFINDVLY